MTQTVSDIIARIEDLTLPERAEVAHAYICSLEPEEEGVSEAWEAELARRSNEIHSGQVVGIPAEQVFGSAGASQ